MFVMQQVLQEHACEPISECFSMHHHAKMAAPDRFLGGLVTSSRLGEGSSVRESREPLPRRFALWFGVSSAGQLPTNRSGCPTHLDDSRHKFKDVCQFALPS